MTSRAVAFVWLLVAWVALLGSLTPGAVVAGATVSAFLLRLFQTHAASGRVRVRPVHAVRFGAYFLGRLVLANLQVARAVVSPGRRVDRGIVAVPVAATTDGLLGLLTGAISLTSGTFILEVRREPATLFVHVLQLGSVEQVRVDVLEMQRRLLRATGSTEALSEVEQRLASLRAAVSGEGTDC